MSWRNSTLAFMPAIALLFLIASSATAVGDDTGKVMLVLDASGSMRGRIDGKVKMSVARQSLRTLLGKWDKNLHLGLTAYGHRRKGDCGDIQLLVPVGAVRKKHLTGIVDKLKPKGKTPLTEAVRRAAAALKYTENKATVILISDGKETCDADPCALGTELEQSGVDFTAHVIGFGVKATEQKGLRCLAKNTGGRFFDARSAGDLSKALNLTVEKVKQDLRPKLNFGAVLKTGDDPLKPGFYANGLKWKFLTKNSDGSSAGKRVGMASGSRVAMDLPSGRYLAKLDWDGVHVKHSFDVEDKVRAEHIVNLDAGIVVLSASLSKSSPTLKGQVGWTYYQTGSGEKLGKKVLYRAGPKVQAILPKGKYTVIVKFDGVSKQIALTVASGERITSNISLGAGTVTIKAVDPDSNGVRGYQTWTIFKTENGSKGKKVAFKADTRPKFYLENGSYELELGFNGAKYRTNFDVVEGENRDVIVTVPGA